MSVVKKPNQRPADFLVIGAMKCGTTTLYHDLIAQPAIFLPDKESNHLLGDSVDFSQATVDRTCGEVCPDYSKFPEIPDVPEQASVCFPDAKIIFIIRHPIERAISHHHFISSLKATQNPGMSRNFEDALSNFPELTDVSRYGFQLEQWAAFFPTSQIRVIRFEDFVSNRIETLRELFEFIGTDYDETKVRVDSLKNSSTNRPVLNPFWKKFRENPLYRKLIRPFTSLELRDKIRARFLPKSGTRPNPPQPETIRKLRKIFREDQRKLLQLLNREEPFWDLEG